MHVGAHELAPSSPRGDRPRVRPTQADTGKCLRLEFAVGPSPSAIRTTALSARGQGGATDVLPAAIGYRDLRT